MADEAIGLVEAAQRPDGYLNTFVQVLTPGNEYRDLQWGHELYCIGHLVQAAVAWHRALGDDRLLLVAERAVASVERELGPGRPRRDRRPPRDRDGARRAVSASPASGASSSSRDAVHRPPRPGPGSATAGSGAATGRTTCRSARRRRRSATRCARCTSTAAPSTSRSRPATTPLLDAVTPPLARHGRDEDVPHRRARQPPQGRGVRRPVRAAAGPGLRRDVRRDRVDDARLAACCSRPATRPAPTSSSGPSTTRSCPSLSTEGTAFFYVNPLQRRTHRIVDRRRARASGRRGTPAPAARRT